MIGAVAVWVGGFALGLVLSWWQRRAAVAAFRPACVRPESPYRTPAPRPLLSPPTRRGRRRARPRSPGVDWGITARHVYGPVCGPPPPPPHGNAFGVTVALACVLLLGAIATSRDRKEKSS